MKKKIILTAVLALTLLSSGSISAAQKPLQRFYGYRPAKESIVHHKLDPAELALGGDDISEQRYVSKAYTQVNDQGITGLCWAFGNTSAAEGSVKAKYNEDVQFSWKNLAYHSVHKNDLKSDFEGKDYRENIFKQDSFDEGPDDDYYYGNYDYAGAHAPGGWGRQEEEYVDCVGNGTDYLFAGGFTYTAAVMYWQNRCLKEDKGDDSLDVDLNDIGSYLDRAAKVSGSYAEDYRLKGAYFVSSASDNINTIKTMLKKYGAGTISYYAGDDDGAYVYCDEELAAEVDEEAEEPGQDFSNHTITLVGWDDSISASEFTGSSGGGGGGDWPWGDWSYGKGDRRTGGYDTGSTPPGDGAWICINSWGTGEESGTDNGYTYISYYDTSIARDSMIFYDICRKSDEKEDEAYLWTDNDYSGEGHDNPSSRTDDLARGLAYKPDKDVTLSSVSFFTAEDNAQYTLYIYGNPTITDGAVSMTGNTPLLTQELDIPMAGIHYQTLDKKIAISSGQTVLLLLKPKKKLKTFVSEAEDYTDEYAYWSDNFYSGHYHYVVDSSGMSLQEESAGIIGRMDGGDVYIRMYSDDGLSEGAASFTGSDFDIEKLVKATDEQKTNTVTGATESYVVENGADKYEIRWTKSVPYTGFPHINTGSSKRKATPDLTVTFLKNGTEISPGEYKLKFRNNKFVSGYKGKYPEIYVIPGKSFDKAFRATLKKQAMRFEIRQCDLSKDIDTENFDPSFNRQWDRVTKINGLRDKTTKNAVKLKLSKNGMKGDVIASINDKGKTVDVILKGINNCTGETTVTFEVDDGSGYGGGYGEGGYGGGYGYYTTDSTGSIGETSVSADAAEEEDAAGLNDHVEEE